MSERYQQEIEEILRQAAEPTPTQGPTKARKRPFAAFLSRIGRGIGNHVYPSSGRLMFIGVVLLLLAIFVSAIFPGLIGPLVWLGLIGFILGYVLFFARPSRSTEKRWRGRLIEPNPPGGRAETWWDRFQRWLKR